MHNPGLRAVARADALFTDKARYMGTWDQVARYVIPRKFVYRETPDGAAARERMILDSTAPQSLIMFGSFLHTTLNNPGDRWFFVEGVDRDALAFDPAALTWAEATETGLNTEFSTGETTVYNVLHEMLLDVGAFGWSCAFMGERKGRFWLRYVGIQQSAVQEGPDGLVDTVAVAETMTVLAARKRWPGKSLGDQFDKVKPEQAPIEQMTCVHIVFPAEDEELVAYLPDEVRGVSAPFYSLWICRESGHVITADWYRQMPYLVPRWSKSTNSAYGRSPAMTALGDILMLNRMNETVLRGAEKLVDPPLLIPDGASLSPVRLFPGGITYTDGDVQAHPLIPPGASRIELGFELIKARQDAVRNAFFVPLFINPEQPVKTATQVMQESDERNRAAAPMVIRLQHELYNPLISRAWSIMLRQGRLPPPPDVVLAKGGARIGYRNPVLASQRQLSGLAAMRWFESLAPWAQVDPGVMDWAQPDETAKVLHQAAGAPAALLRSKQEVDQLRRARHAQEQQAAQTQTALQGVEATAKMVAAQGGRR